MDCNRCHGLVIQEKSWSADNDFRKLTYLRCVNCGNYQFPRKDSESIQRASKPRLPAAA